MHKFNISLSVLTKKNFKILNIYLSLYALFNSLPIFIPYYSNKLFFNILYYSQFQNYNLFSPKNITSHSNKSSNLESIFLGNKSTNLTRRKFIINKTFNSYINIFFYTYIPNFNIHSSFINLYTTNSTKGSYTISITKLYSLWTNIYTLIYNLYFYNLNPTVFGNNYFKKEIIPLNWYSLTNYNKINWKFSKLLLFVLPSPRTNNTYTMFKLLTIKGFLNSIVLDITYHKITLDYLHKLSIFTIGIVPTIYNIKSVDFSIPVSKDSIFNQLFMLRLIYKINKSVQNDKYYIYRFAWNNII